MGRKCGECDLAIKGLCPSAVVAKEVKRKVKKELKVEEDGEQVVKKEEGEETVVKLEKADPDAPPLALTPGGEARDGVGMMRDGEELLGDAQ